MRKESTNAESLELQVGKRPDRSGRFESSSFAGTNQFAKMR